MAKKKPKSKSPKSYVKDGKVYYKNINRVYQIKKKP